MRIAIASLISALILTGTSAPVDVKTDIEKELKKFQHTWTFESVEAAGMTIPADNFEGITLTFDGEKYAVKKGDEVVEAGTLKLDPSKSPKTFDATVTEGPNKGTVILAIYEIDDDTLKVCFDPEGKKRPTEFKTGTGSETLVIHKRVKK